MAQRALAAICLNAAPKGPAAISGPRGGSRCPFPAWPLALAGTPFSQDVWRLLRSIPYGETTTYEALAKELAARAGRAKISARAVGSVVGRNQISIIVPCRQVAWARGDLIGYGGGLSNKIRLLELEGADMSTEGTPQSRRATAAPAALRP